MRRVKIESCSIKVKLPNLNPASGTITVYSPSLDFSIANNSQYIPIIF